jgi:hypothetical protein
MAWGERTQRVNDLPKVQDLVGWIIKEAEGILKNATKFLMTSLKRSRKGVIHFSMANPLTLSSRRVKRAGPVLKDQNFAFHRIITQYNIRTHMGKLSKKPKNTPF